jgi:hypothetical protein
MIELVVTTLGRFIAPRLVQAAKQRGPLAQRSALLFDAFLSLFASGDVRLLGIDPTTARSSSTLSYCAIAPNTRSRSPGAALSKERQRCVTGYESSDIVSPDEAGAISQVCWQFMWIRQRSPKIY